MTNPTATLTVKADRFHDALRNADVESGAELSSWLLREHGCTAWKMVTTTKEDELPHLFSTLDNKWVRGFKRVTIESVTDVFLTFINEDAAMMFACKYA